MTRDDLRQDVDQFRRLQGGSARRFLNSITGSPDADPVPFVIWATALALTPPLLTAIRHTLRLSMTAEHTFEQIDRVVEAFAEAVKRVPA